MLGQVVGDAAALVASVGWDGRPGATAAQQAAAEAAVGRRLPADLRAFLRWSDGGAAWRGGQGLSLYATAELPARNRDYGLPRWLPGYLAIGDDAGGRCYALDYQSGAAPTRVVRVAYGDLAAEAAVPVAVTFTDLVARFVRGALPAEPPEQLQGR